MSIYPCYKFTEGNVYNLQFLKNLDKDWSARSADPQVPGTVFWNLCHYADTSTCKEGMEDAFAFRSKGEGSCDMLTSEWPQADLTDDVSRENPLDG